MQRVGRIGPFGLGATQDYKNSKETIAALYAGGLSLPDRDYYFKDDERSKTIRDEFLKHVAKMLELAGDTPEAAARGRHGDVVRDRAGQATMTRVQRRDPYATYHRMSVAEMGNWPPTTTGRSCSASSIFPSPRRSMSPSRSSSRWSAAN